MNKMNQTQTRSPRKRLLSLILAVILMIGLLPISAFATGDGYELSAGSRFFIVNESDPTGTDLGNFVQLIGQEFAAKGKPSSSVLPIVYGQEKDAEKGDIVVKLDSSLGEQSYKVSVGQKIVVTGGDAAGAFYGLTNLLQMFEKNSLQDVTNTPLVAERSAYIDCGRVYFSPEMLKALIKTLAWNRMNTLYLDFSNNNATRFFMNEMKVTVDGTTYDITKAKPSDGKYLTQADMVDIIKVAKQYGVQIIPTFNSPGHIGGLYSLNNSFFDKAIATDYDNSCGKVTLLIENKNAYDFGQAVVKLYVDFFAGQGCKSFNIAADEATLGNVKYDSTNPAFVNYVNDLNTYIKGKGMTTRMFCDGVKSTDKVDKDIVILYWQAQSPNAQSFADAGYQVVNMSANAGLYYAYVGNRSSWWVWNQDVTQIYNSWNPSIVCRDCDNSSTYTVKDTVTSDKLLGAVFAMWTDYAHVDGCSGNYLIEKDTNSVVEKIQVVGDRCWNNKSSETYANWKAGLTTAPGGINVSTYAIDGTVLPAASGITAASQAEIPVADNNTGVSVVVKGEKGQTGSLTVDKLETSPNAEAITAAGAEKSVSYNVTPAVDGKDYTGEGTVTLPVPEGWATEASRIRAYIIDNGAVKLISGTLSGGKYTFQVPHFSEMGLLQVESGEIVNVTVSEGGTKVVTINGKNYAGSYETTDPTIATVTVTGQNASTKTTYEKQSNITYSTLLNEDASSWTNTSYYYLSDGQYYHLYAKRSSYYYGYYYYSFAYGESANNPTVIGNQVTTWSPSSESPSFDVYSPSGTESVPAFTKITFKGLKQGDPVDVTIGDTIYRITVTEKQNVEIPISIIDYRADGLLFDYSYAHWGDYPDSYRYSLVHGKSIEETYYSTFVTASKDSNGLYYIDGTDSNVEKIAGTRIEQTRTPENSNYVGKFNSNNMDNSWSRAGLVQERLGSNGMPVYTDAAVRYVAGLLEAGYYNKMDGSCNSDIYDTFVAADGKRSIHNTSTTAFSAQFEVTKSYNDIKTAYDLAWYLLNTIYQPDTEATVNVKGTDGKQHDVPLYGMAVDTYKSIVLTDGGNGKYTFEAGYKSNNVEYPQNVNFDRENGEIYNGGDEKNLGFYPLDGLGYERSGLLTNTSKIDASHNGSFTLRGESQFVYNKDANLYFTFTGDDDVYMYINGVLALDLGGAHGRNTKTVKLDSLDKDTYKLKDGEVATFTFFYMERCSDASTFAIETNMKLVQRDIAVEKNAYSDSQYTRPVNSGAVVDNGRDLFYDLVVTNKGNTVMTNFTFEDTDSFTGKANLGYSVTNAGVTAGLEDKDKNLVSLSTNGYTYFVTDADGNQVGETKTVASLEELSAEVANVELAANQSLHVRFLKATVNVAKSKIISYTNTVKVTASAGGARLWGDGSHSIYAYNDGGTARTYVVDFGLPLKIEKIFDPSAKNYIDNASGTIALNGQPKYGTAELTAAGYGSSVVYRLNAHTTIDGQDTITLNVPYKFDDAERTLPKTLNIIPASNVYYEDSLATFTNGKGVAQNAVWSTVGNDDKVPTEQTDVYQALEELGGATHNVYGYDGQYSNSSMLSMGTAHKVTVTSEMLAKWEKNDTTSAWPTASFTFTGTGFDVISLTDNTSGAILVKVTGAGADNKDFSKNYLVNNYYGYKQVKNEDGSISWVVSDSKEPNALYQIPVMKVDVPYGAYNVTIQVFYNQIFDKTGNDRYNFWLDAIRVYNPMGENGNSYYTQDNEGYPQYIKLHDALADGTAKPDGKTDKMVFIDGGSTADIATYANYGPNNEVYLMNGQAITFKIPANDKIASIQIGAKAPDGKANMVVKDGTGAERKNQELNTATEMYYEISTTSGQFTISNTGDGILSLTNLKITYKIKPAENEKVTLAALDTQEQENAVSLVRALFTAPVATFSPETFEADWGRAVRAGKRATLTVKTSADVESITVDGQSITSYTTRTQRTGWGWWSPKVTYHVFTYTITAPAQTTDYAVCAVNAEGTASEAVTATLTVKPTTWWNWWF